jgi:hypothetical protein
VPDGKEIKRPNKASKPPHEMQRQTGTADSPLTAIMYFVGLGSQAWESWDADKVFPPRSSPVSGVGVPVPDCHTSITTEGIALSHGRFGHLGHLLSLPLE